MGFHVGQRVKCVESFCDGYLPDNRKGDEYIIARIVPGSSGTDGLIFEGTPIIPWPRNPSFLMSYAQARFRPLVETNIDIFQAMLVNPHREVELT